MISASTDQLSDSQAAIRDLLQKCRLVEDLVHKQDMPKHELVESLVKKQNIAKLQKILNHLPTNEVGQLLESLTPNDQLFIWDQLRDERKQDVLLEVPISVIELLGKRDYKTENSRVKVFEMHEGRLKEASLDNPDALSPIWVDLVSPNFEDRTLVGSIFNIELPDPEKISDLESSARCYIEANGDIHLHSDFLLDGQIARNIAVAFILHQNILFTVRQEELPLFRLQRLRALSQPGFVTDARDLLLTLYAADIEHSADALENIYRGLEDVGAHVLSKQMTDEEAARVLNAIAHQEDLNGRIRRNVMDSRRAVSFLMRSRLIEKQQTEDAQQILRDIESLDGHTAFLFEKINFLMDATVGFININQNKVIKRLTVISVIFMPLNLLAGIGGMSEYSMMTEGVPWPMSYALFGIGVALAGWLTYYLLKLLERREKLQQATQI